MGYNIVGRASDIIPNYQLTDSTRRSWAEKNRPVMARFMKAMALAMRWLYDNKEPTIDFLAKEMNASSPSRHAKAGNTTPRKNLES